MAQAAVRTDLGQVLDVQSHLAAKVAFHDELFVDALTDTRFFLVGKVAHAGVRVDSGLFENSLRARSADTENVGQTDLDSLVSGQVNAGNSCHVLQSFLSMILCHVWGWLGPMA